MDIRKTVLDTVKQVRGAQPFALSERNQNIYRILLDEPNGEKTAYYFNSPLYRRRDGCLIDKRFVSQNNMLVFEGSNATILYTNGKFDMHDYLGNLLVQFGTREPLKNMFGSLHGSNLHIQPTFNGISVEASCQEGTPFCFTIRTSETFEKIKSNTKYVAFMRTKFEPFFIISPLYARISGRKDLIPCTISITPEEDNTYLVTIQAATHEPHTILFEINLYEGKFFQDTTVESEAPNRNNCYGSVSFLGQTAALGEQWLYTKTSRTKVFDIENIPIQSVRMFIPVFQKGNILPMAYLPLERFCSFGSTWKKKVPCTENLTTAQYDQEYYILDLSDLLINPSTHFLRQTEGFILRLTDNNNGCSVIATGDCCIASQFLEIKYH